MEFVSYEIAKKLKEKGFREKCLHHYNNNGVLKENYSKCYCSANNIFTDNTVDAPTISQVLKWLRDKKKIAVNVEFIPFVWQYKIIDMSVEMRFEDCGKSFYTTYEEAAHAGIEYVLDNLI